MQATERAEAEQAGEAEQAVDRMPPRKVERDGHARHAKHAKHAKKAKRTEQATHAQRQTQPLRADPAWQAGAARSARTTRAEGTLTKARLVERLYDEFGFSKAEAKEFVEAFFETIRACLERNEPVKLLGFGVFDLRDKRERPGRNPKTGEAASISARRVVAFRPGERLRASAQRHQPPDASGEGLVKPA